MPLGITHPISKCLCTCPSSTSDSSYLLMQILGGSSDSLSNWCTVTYMKGLSQSQDFRHLGNESMSERTLSISISLPHIIYIKYINNSFLKSNRILSCRSIECPKTIFKMTVLLGQQNFLLYLTHCLPFFQERIRFILK